MSEQIDVGKVLVQTRATIIPCIFPCSHCSNQSCTRHWAFFCCPQSTSMTYCSMSCQHRRYYCSDKRRTSCLELIRSYALIGNVNHCLQKGGIASLEKQFSSCINLLVCLYWKLPGSCCVLPKGQSMKLATNFYLQQKR